MKTFRDLIEALPLFFFIACFPAAAFAGSDAFSFAFVALPQHAASAEPTLRAALTETDKDNLAFVVMNGIKTQSEPCDDALYEQRRDILTAAGNGIVYSPAGGDWRPCRDTEGRSVAQERLNRLRELFFADSFSLGSSRIPVMRESRNVKFRSYPENARWTIGGTIFATVDLPAENNDYVSAAGRNAEFEDRLVANRDWLKRIFFQAGREHMKGIVLFCDGDPLAPPAPHVRRDGFAEMRQVIEKLSAKFRGKVLIVHSHAGEAADIGAGIEWRKNIGDVDAGGGWIEIDVDPAQPRIFSLKSEVIEKEACAGAAQSSYCKGIVRN